MAFAFQAVEMKRVLAAVLLLALVATLGAAGAEFHVCSCDTGADVDCVTGSDGAAGSPAAPWLTFEKARLEFADLAAGDAIRFCRGGAWDIDAGTRWVNVNCEATAPCVVGDYSALWASGDEARPILTRTDGAHGFALEDGGDAEHEEGYLFENLDLRGTPTGWGFFLYNDIDDVTLRNLSITDFGIGVHLAGSNACNGGDPECDGRNERIVLEDSYIGRNEDQGWLGASSGSKILRNSFEANGSTAVFDHNIYVSGSGEGQTQGVEVVGNTLYQSALDSDGVCRGVSLVVHGTHDDLLIADNIVREDVGFAGQGCWGIAIDNGYSSAEGFTNVVIRGNTVLNVGNVAIGVGSCVDCTIENNVIVHQQEFGVTAIAAPDRSPGDGDLEQDNITVRNNSIWIDTASGATAIYVREFGDDHVVVSNAIHNTGASSGFNCLDVDLPPSAYTEIDHNLCWFPDAPNAEWANGFGSSPDALQAWRNATGFGDESAMADPGFADPAAFDLAAASEAVAMIDAGHPSLSSSTGFGGSTRGADPDAGAWEWGAGELIFIDGFESGDTSVWDVTVP